MNQAIKTMKRTPLAIVLICAWFGWSSEPAMGQTNQKASTARIGIYDSRVIAYARFWSEPYQQKLRERNKTAQQAKAAGETARFNEFAAAMKKEQEQNHLRVFSTAPVDDILAGMKERVAAIQKEAGVARLVSKWDEKALKAYKPDQQIDVTDQLLREFKLNEKQLKVVADLRKQKPLPLDQAQELMRKGEL
jgi:hypothetical protein